MKRIPILIATILVALTGPGAALHCNGDITAIPVGDEIFYIDDRSDAAGEIDHWVYQEDNGREGLQSGAPCSFQGCEPPPFGSSERCDHPNPDLLIV